MMSQSASQSAIFYRDVKLSRKVWTIRDIEGFPAPMNSEGKRAMPFWSSKSRAEIIIKSISAYNGFEPVELSLNDFYKKWLPGLIKDELLVGVNWSGNKVIGYDLNPENIIDWLDKIN